MKKLILIAIAQFFILGLKAQTAEDSVKTAINQMFAAMKSSDAKSLRECFADSAILQTITRSGTIRNESVDEFAKQISTLPKDSADERISFETLKVDDGLAIAWTPYNFYYAGKFSHCGVNSFQLVRQNGRWKIQYLIDTRRRVGCK
ncbi:MAG: nuclear transport factor 2 family protein [Chitinophagaceae bacterium]|nr:MAG: nuclear transport factor 2 family protein [Chitinophagaceae bacterium]